MAEGGDAATVAHEAGNAVQETPKAEPEKAAAAAEPAAPAEPPEPTVRTIVLTGHGGYDKLSVQQKPQPKAGKGEVLVRVKAAGLNFSELMVRQGLHDRMTKPPVVLGMEAAGVIEELGEDVSDFEVGSCAVPVAPRAGEPVPSAAAPPRPTAPLQSITPPLAVSCHPVPTARASARCHHVFQNPLNHRILPPESSEMSYFAVLCSCSFPHATLRFQLPTPRRRRHTLQ
ncbi:Synaptic vesicle membrane protein VAT-1 [Branchiostoma belcheri]|nr:Synaptic vesicle membrane protein VAT-1 [Branchiostoma belcheri]